MPTVPFPQRSQGGAAPQVDQNWLLVAAGDLHAEGKLFEPEVHKTGAKQGGTYIGDAPEGDDLSWERTLPIGRRGDNGKVERTVEPKDLMHKLAPDEEAYTLPDNPHLWIRKKRKAPPSLEDLVS